MRGLTVSLLAYWLIFLLIVAPRVARGQKAEENFKPRFPTEVDLVTVDVVVTDKHGQPIAGLSRDDFYIEEEGRPQVIESFEAFTVPARAASTAPVRTRISTNVAHPTAGPGRTFVVVFDDLNLSPFQTPQARQAVRHFLEQDIREGDRVMLASTSGAAWWNTHTQAGKAKLLALVAQLKGSKLPDTSPERMSDWEALRIHIFRDPLVARRVARRFRDYGVTPAADVKREEYRFNFEDPYLLSRARQVYREGLTRQRHTFEVLRRVLKSLAAAKGRKSVVFISQGFVHDPSIKEFQLTVEDARRSNVAVYFVDVRGLGGLPIETSVEFEQQPLPQDLGAHFSDHQLATEGSENLASYSGGFSVKNTNDFEGGLRRIASESETYYLLGYVPTDKRQDGQFRKIKVKVARKGTKVRARKGRYALLAGEKVRRSDGPAGPDFQPALDSPFALDGVTLQMTSFVFHEALPGEASVLVATAVDLGGLAFVEREGRFLDDVAYLLVIASPKSGQIRRFEEKVAMDFLPGTYKGLKDGYVIAKQVQLPPGDYQARIAVRDGNSGRIGTVVHEFEVPALDQDQLRTSTPLLTDTLQTGQGGRPRPVLRVRRDYSPDATLYCEFQVYGAAKGPGTGQPRVAAGYAVVGADGTTVARVEPNPIRPDAAGGLSRLVGTPLGGTSPGRYELVLYLRDHVAGKNLEVREPFTVRSPKGP